MVSSKTDYEKLAMVAVLPEEAYLEGLIFGVAACPEIPMPEQWMPWAIRADANTAISKQQADELADYLMGRLRDTLDSMRKEERLLPEECQWRGNGLQHDELQQWLRGLLTAHQQLEKQWQQAWQMSEQTLDLPALSGRLNRCLKLFTTLADPQSRLQQTPPEKRQELTDGLPRLAASLPPMLKEYVAISGELVQVLPNQFEVVPKTTGE